MLSTLQTTAFAFDYSAKRLLAFQESLRQDVLVREEMETRAKLRTLCETRWASWAHSLYTFRTAYPVASTVTRDYQKMEMRRQGGICVPSNHLISS